MLRQSPVPRAAAMALTLAVASSLTTGPAGAAMFAPGTPGPAAREAPQPRAGQGRVDSVDAARGTMMINRVQYLVDLRTVRAGGVPGGLPGAGTELRFMVIPDGDRQRITQMEKAK